LLQFFCFCCFVKQEKSKTQKFVPVGFGLQLAAIVSSGKFQ